MPSFALITEGLTDQVVLERVINLACQRSTDVIVNPVQPSRDATNKFTAPHGGWEKVFEFCQQSIDDALFTNDYIVIHLDTDDGDHPNFGLRLYDDGNARSFHELVLDARLILQTKIGNEKYEANAHRIVFAIAVHSTECWLNIILFDEYGLFNGFDRLRNNLRKSGGKLSKDYRVYSQLVCKIKLKRLMKLHSQDNSLGMFLEELSAICRAGDE